VKGEKYFEFIVDKYNIPAVITGFEELDIVGALYFLLEQQKVTNKSFLNLYKSCVTYEGNQKANELMEELFTYGCEGWRGIGKLQNSGFILREKYSSYDATRRFGLKIKKKVSRSCICSDILLGKRLPNECEYFGKTCTPSLPLGPCMISSEGSCSVYYKYMDKRILI
jgi:hydrogenase expression/formation protein HypD